MQTDAAPPDETEEQVAGPEVVTMTTAMLKALSHPLRRAILQVLRRREFARAADVAAELGEPANKVSFHLRALQGAGLIVEASERARDRRDRVWTMVSGPLSLGDPEHPVADEALGDAVMSALVEEHYALVRRLVAWAPAYVSGHDPDVHGTFTKTGLQLTPAEFEDLLRRINDAILAAKDQHVAGDPDTRAYEIDIVAADDRI